jgi:hypothetical protein
MHFSKKSSLCFYWLLNLNTLSWMKHSKVAQFFITSKSKTILRLLCRAGSFTFNSTLLVWLRVSNPLHEFYSSVYLFHLETGPNGLVIFFNLKSLNFLSLKLAWFIIQMGFAYFWFCKKLSFRYIIVTSRSQESSESGYLFIEKTALCLTLLLFYS